MLIWFMNKIYLFFILVCCVQSYWLPFSYRLRLRKLTKAEDRNPPITAHTLTTVWPLCYSDYWQQNGVHVTVCLGLNFRTRPHSTLRKKEEKTKFWGRLVESVVFQKAVIESSFDYWIKTEYEYWIVHFMNGLLNEQTKSFSH